MISKDKQLLEIQRGTEEILVEEEFTKRFHQKKPLKIKFYLKNPFIKESALFLQMVILNGLS